MNARESCSKHIHLGLWPLVAFRECFWVLLSDFWEGVFTLFSIAYYFSLKTNPLTLMSAEPLVQKAVDVNCSGSVMDGDTEGSCSSKPTDGETDKHVLQNRWSFFYNNPKANPMLSWEEKLQKIYTFETVEDFWALFNSVVGPSRLSIQADYYLFKEGVRPSYEENPEGGVWMFNLEKGNKKRLEEVWLYLVLGLIGETMEDSNDILGAVVSIKRGQDRLSLWTKTAADKELQVRIATRVKMSLDLPPETKLEFKPNQKVAEAGGSMSSAQDVKGYTV
ncbi:eukaryotic translation initiation factor iso4e [Nannochloropsis gaditana]|uniref:Eukaryotic translation initiation factor iso4e n=2 Tax=Nannochloropsis gaditana TaxID=72520 RepID=W7TNA8_9STRA|nr:eukaryotic translation initiation factor iso4e [Nannochloropsis gaditana]